MILYLDTYKRNIPLLLFKSINTMTYHKNIVFMTTVGVITITGYRNTDMEL